MRVDAAADDAASLRLRRVATWGLALLGSLLLLDGPASESVWTGGSPTAATDPSAVIRPTITTAIDRHLRDRRSLLSAQERDRVIDAILRSSDRYGLDPFLVTAVLLVESDVRPWARSGKGAIGLMQVMPHMAEGLPLAGNLATIESNIEAGCFILADNIRRLGEARGISSYFWGRRIRGVAYLEKVQRARDRVRGAGGS